MNNNIDILFKIARPLSPFYSTIMTLRRLAYMKGILRSKKIDGFTISIGNITLGGTGKSPHVFEIAHFLKEKGQYVAIISRGYGGKIGRGPAIVNKNKTDLIPSKICGDEPYMLAQKLPDVPVIVGSDRYKGCVLAQKNFKTNVFILDDGFQHLRLKRDLDIILISATHPFGNGKVFPGGHLREKIESLAYASAIIITKVNYVSLEQIEKIKQKLEKYNKPIFLSYYKIQSVYFPFLKKELTPSEIKDNKAVAFCALAEPNSFFNLLKEYKITLYNTYTFRDHYFFKEKDLFEIYQKAKNIGAKYVLTTEKDFAKIPPFKWKSFDKDGILGIVKISTQIEKPFWDFLLKSISKKD